MQTGMLKILIIVIFGISAISVSYCQTAVLHKVVLKEPGALCLDGSPGVYYFLRGTNPRGGWCGNKDLASTTQSCYQRSKGELGSSKNYPDTMTQTSGILSNNAQNELRDATKVYIKYCDGSGHQGSKSAPVVYKDAKVYFRGHNITEAVFQQIQKSEGLFSKATQIIVTGTSAGGLASFVWVDYVRSKAKAAKSVYAIPDSGIFLDSANILTHQHQFVKRFINLFKISNVQTQFPVPDCVKAYPGQTYKCMFVQNLYKFIKSPIFAVQSLYDSYSIPNILGILCVNGTTSLKNCTQTQMNYIQQYHRNTSVVLQNIAKSSHNGFWGISCAHHTFIKGANFYSAQFRVPQNSNYSIQETVVSWIKGESTSHKHLDPNAWPSNKPCSGTTSPQVQYQ